MSAADNTAPANVDGDPDVMSPSCRADPHTPVEVKRAKRANSCRYAQTKTRSGGDAVPALARSLRTK